MSGHYEAYCDLALCFLDGDGVARNQKQGLKYIELAANKGIDEHNAYSVACIMRVRL